MNMHQRAMRPKLQAFLDGELPEAQIRATASHLRDCRQCAEELKRLADTERMLTETTPELLPLSAERSQALFERAFAEAALPAHASRPALVGSPLRLAGLCAAALIMGTTISVLAWNAYFRSPQEGSSHPPAVVLAPTNPDKHLAAETIALPDGDDDSIPETLLPPPAGHERTDAVPHSPGATHHRRHSFLRRRRSHGESSHWAPRHRRHKAQELFFAKRSNARPQPERIETAFNPESDGPGATEQLLVILEDTSTQETPPPAPTLTVQVTHEPESAPGLAQAAAYRPDSTGREVWTQYSVCKESTGETAARYAAACVTPNQGSAFLAVQAVPSGAGREQGATPQ